MEDKTLLVLLGLGAVGVIAWWIMTHPPGPPGPSVEITSVGIHER